MSYTVTEATVVFPDKKAASSFSSGYASKKPCAHIDCELEGGFERSIWIPVRVLDENRFCSYFIEERKRRGWGQRKIETELKRRHVVLDDIPGYPEDFFAVEDDLARASALLAKRRVPETRGFEKLVRFLMGKGFSYHIAADAVKARLDAEREECAV